MENSSVQSCHLLVQFIVAVVGHSLTDEDWTNGDESLNLESEVGEFFYYKYRGRV